jgi:hypothetical protein
VRTDPYRAPPEAPPDDTDVPAVVPLTILALLLGLLIAFFAPHRAADNGSSVGGVVDRAPLYGHFAPRR